MEQSYENGGADFDGIAAPSPSASNMSDISGSASNATTTVESQSNKKSKISEKVKESKSRTATIRKTTVQALQSKTIFCNYFEHKPTISLKKSAYVDVDQ